MIRSPTVLWACVCLFAGFASPSSADVGRTSGEFDVSATGAVQYSIPIWTPQGPNGVQPGLALAYNSQLGNGIPGVGWSIVGLSSIERCGKTTPQDGSPAGFSMTVSDAYCLLSGPLGGRLRKTGGTYGLDGSTYQLEVADFSQITVVGNGTNGPDHFILKAKDGLIYEYGNTSNSRVPLPNTTTTLRWMLSKVRDRAGNNYIVDYNVSGGWGNPNQISFGAASTTPSTYNYTINFAYSPTLRSLTDSVLGFVAGQSHSDRALLTDIRVKSGATTVRRYVLGTDTSPVSGLTRLTQIKECSDEAAANCLSPTTVTYQGGAAGVASVASGPASAPSLQKGKYDFNGDGKSDLLYVSGSTWVVALASGTGFLTAVSTAIPSANAPLIERFLADGKDGILANISGTLWYYAWNGSAFTGTSTGAAAAGANLAADTDGDGRLDLVYSNGTSVFIQLNTTAVGATVPTFSATATTAATLGGFDPQPGHGMIIISGLYSRHTSGLRRFDFNNDGRQDVYATVRQTWDGFTTIKTLFGNGTTFTVSSASYPVDSPWINFNSDTCSDAVGFNLVYLSACNGNVASTISFANSGVGPLAVMDLDGDRRPDILVKNGATVGVYFSTSTGLSSLTSTSVPYSATNSYFVFDQDGDGLDDLGVVSSTNAVTFYYHQGGGYVSFYAIQVPNILASVTDGYGVNYTPLYVSIAQNNYTDGVFPTGTLTTVPPPLQPVVGQVTTSDGTGTTYFKTYNYARARQDNNRSNTFGFEEFRVTDSRDQLTRKTIYRVDFPFTGQVAEEDLYQPNGTTLMSSTVNLFSKMDLDTATNNQRVYPYISKSTTRIYEAGPLLNGNLVTEAVSDFIVDNYGNTTQVTTKTTDKDVSSPWYTEEFTTVATQHFDYTTAATNWCIHIPDQTSEQSSLPNTSSLTLSTAAGTAGSGIDYPNCRVTQQIIQPGDSTQQITTNYEFLPAGCGQPTKISVLGKNPDSSAMAARDTVIGYGSRCQFAQSVTNAEGESATLGYRFDIGVQDSQIDPNSLTTSWTFDNFGRLTHEARPDITATDWTRYRCVDTPGFCPAAGDLVTWVKTIERNTANGPIRESRDFYDSFGRLRFRQAQNSVGVFTYDIHAGYDALGNESISYEPSFTTGGNYHSYTRDLWNRVTSIKSYLANGTLDREVKVAYAGRTNTITDARLYDTQQLRDVLGNVRKVIDPSPGGTTLYGYDPFGRLASITDAAGNVISQQFNIYGLRTRLDHPDRGTWLYRPNSLGDLVSYTDAKNPGASSVVASFLYDRLGRVTQRSEPEGLTSWTWGRTTDNSATHKYVGWLKGVTSPGGYAEDHIYDGLGRPQTTTYTEGTNYSFDYDYNDQGSLNTLTYPTSTASTRLKLKYLYGYGVPTQIQDFTTGVAGTNYWTLNATDERGNYIDESLGNGVRVLSGFDLLTGNLIYRESGNGGSTTNLQNLTYDWDKNSNLHQRKDETHSLTEVFTNDSLNRLTGSTLNSTPNLAITYSAIGNMLSWQYNGASVNSKNYTTPQSGCTYYAYAQPHALRNNTQSSWSGAQCYDANGNATTHSTNGTPDGSYTWTSFNQPSLLSWGTSSSQFFYDANHQRWKQSALYSGAQEDTVYVGGLLEVVTTPTGTAYRHNIPAGNNTVVATRWSTGANPTYYVTTDHLGSSGAITDATGTLLVNESFAASGFRRGNDWVGGQTPAEMTQINNITRHGFTGHEMLDNLYMVNMNGRIYDGGTFISPDPFIQDPYDSQNLNPYSYVNNRPLSLTDPTGYAAVSGDPDTPPPLLPFPPINPYHTYYYCDFHNCGYTGPGVIPGTSILTATTADSVGGSGLPNPYCDFSPTDCDAKVFADDNSVDTVCQPMGYMFCLPMSRREADVAAKQQGVIAIAAGAILTARVGGPLVVEALGPVVMRQMYVNAVSRLANVAARMRAQGATSEQIARALHAARRALGEKFKNLTNPEKLAEIYARNLAKYGDKLGPTIEWLRAQGKTWEEIIESASRTGGKDLGL